MVSWLRLHKLFGEFDPPKNKIYALIVSVPNSQFQDEIVLRCIEKFRKNSSYDRLDTESEYESNDLEDSEESEFD